MKICVSQVTTNPGFQRTRIYPGTQESYQLSISLFSSKSNTQLRSRMMYVYPKLKEGRVSSRPGLDVFNVTL